MRRSVIGLVACLALTGLAGCASMNSQAGSAPQPTKTIDAARFYRGTWHEIGRRPMSLTDGCVAGATQYAPKGGGDIDVLDSCRMKTPTGELKTIGGPGRIMDPGTNARLRVRYSFLGLPVTRDYWILDRADDYSWFISSDPTFHDLWIYTRSPRVSAAERKRLIGKASALGYDVSKLEFPAQP